VRTASGEIMFFGATEQSLSEKEPQLNGNQPLSENVN
jgi:hypothetical protein